ncbi:O-antigen ligase family protein [Octadecabacter sp. G9-8]|uniref:O-antigen ligase family protein n=1 Tax=Octadecabacter dasysiphoniae TaxID=2909341 RepID=A0ABS9CVI1_9RHOB|nr:O-antigen ligase family protein [Octadecabacter dasysiphoniae]MCF2870941.1 O-antigen ligase family protein [Octadecabacter dasysiphoniae]
MNKILLQCGFLMLFAPVLTGSIFFESRLAILPSAYISVNTVAFLVALACAAVELPRYPKKFLFLLALMTVLISHAVLAAVVLGVDIMGIIKFMNFALIGFTLAFLMHALDRRGCLDWAVKVFVAVLFVLFIGAVFVKLQTGFWFRQNPYFMHGSIVFGRLMAMGLLLNLFIPIVPGKLSWALNACFAFGIVWSLSKGPIVAITACGLLYLLLNRSELFKLRNLVLFAMLLAAVSYYVSTYGLPAQFARVTVLFDILMGSEVTVNTSGSIGIRGNMYGATQGMILESPFLGVGMGNWGANFYDGITPFTYPHNLFLELLSEMGLIAGGFFAVLLLLPLRYHKDPFFYLFLFLFLAQQSSGDVADGRFLFFATCLILFRNLILDRIDLRARAST